MSNVELKRFRGAVITHGTVLTVESPRSLFDLIETFDETRLAPLLHDYFGERPMLLARKCTLRRTSPNGQNGGWHQDGAFMGTGIRSLNVSIPLTHCGDTAPGLDIVGRRLDEIVQTGQGAIYAWATTSRMPPNGPRPDPWCGSSTEERWCSTSGSAAAPPWIRYRRQTQSGADESG